MALAKVPPRSLCPKKRTPRRTTKKGRVVSAPLGRNSQQRAKVTPTESQLP